MTQYNTLNVKQPNSQLNLLKFGIKSNTEVILKLLSNAAGDSNNENNFPRKSLLTNIQFQRLFKEFNSNNSSANIKLSKT